MYVETPSVCHVWGLMLAEFPYRERETAYRRGSLLLGASKSRSAPITRADNSKPYRSPQRRYGSIQREFIIQTIRELESVGAIYKNNAARWSSPALAVLKPSSTKLRFTVDLRGPNARTVPIQSAMPHLESHFQDISGSSYFANIDLAHGYWQIPLAKESQEMMSIQTQVGVYSSKRLLQGGSDSGNHFQADLVCEEINLKVHAEKSNFFARKVTFCGRTITPEGIQYHPRHFESLLSMKRPTTAGDLQQLLCAANWMRNSILQYAVVVEPLHSLMEASYAKVGGKRQNALFETFPSPPIGAPDTISLLQRSNNN
eukprot:IDg14233t1